MIKKVAFIAVGVGTIILASQSICYVPEGHRMIIFHKLKGVLNQTYPEGFHLKNPFTDVTNFRMKDPNTVQDLTLNLETVDREQVKIHLRTLNKPDVQNLPNMYMFYGLDYEKIVLNSIIWESAKEVIGSKFTAKDILVNRQRFLDQLKQNISQKGIQKYFIEVLDISIAGIELSEEFQDQMKRKQQQNNQN